ncbi:MAG TPA: VOC family protein [Vicinamibacteria bacterium]
MEREVELARVIVFVKDLPRMASFYTEDLGLPVVQDRAPEGWVELAAGGIAVALHAIPAQIAAGIVVTDPPRPREETPLKLVFRVADVAAARARLLGRGVIMRELRPWGACDGVDPEGNVFQIAQR